MTDLADAGSVAASSQPAGNPERPPAGADNGSAVLAGKSWFDGLSEGNRKLAEAKGWTKPESLDRVFTSYAELERRQGESLRVPARDAPKEDWDKFHARLPEAMRPLTSPEKVEYRRPDGLPETFAYSDELAQASKAWAVEAGATPKIAQAYHDRFVGYMAEQAAAQQAALARSVEATHDDLVKDWGPADSDGFRQKLEVANRAMKKLGLVDAYKQKGILLPDGALTDPQIARAFQAIGEAMFREDTIDADAAPRGQNPFRRNAAGERNVSAISALVKSDPQRARRLAREAGENPDLWMPNNPL
ncbi:MULTISPECIES: hypothetical protein [unclassified Mesorhizobium]|uniref:hypothetical protein n=1 Tax=unclassified Mesorhizobium TaxID=325217 RepID=UPI00112D36A6|nr:MULTISPECIES: hypothetical protein [unclassified Mesorhizobium]MBZ9703054.1 hypothetical protein [Mesorhizobium sp. CO1-1-3]MBZ9949844.1 hypothetical protein [Mesorhizobium sp. BR1-1-11]TPJ07632.1 hypothetical protein FJ428_04600 [Mesorhizobium sp. B2-8-1]TPN07122.1 hypothetical protein FJ973_23240 [Mesorhizobium sp. B2-1-3]TPN46579.1 hypothetical protein FJ981_25610 [Mesorhizobium sp. B1-1-4]